MAAGRVTLALPRNHRPPSTRTLIHTPPRESATSEGPNRDLCCQTRAAVVSSSFSPFRRPRRKFAACVASPSCMVLNRRQQSTTKMRTSFYSAFISRAGRQGELIRTWGFVGWRLNGRRWESMPGHVCLRRPKIGPISLCLLRSRADFIVNGTT